MAKVIDQRALCLIANGDGVGGEGLWRPLLRRGGEEAV